MITYPIQAVRPAVIEHLFSLGVTVPEDIPVIILATSEDRSRAIAQVVGTSIILGIDNVDLLRNAR